MILRPYLYPATGCASYLFGCTTKGLLGVVDPHIDLVEDYQRGAEGLGAPIAAVFETHVQADHRTGAQRLARDSGATIYMPAGADVEFAHEPLGDGDRVELGNTIVTTVSTPGHAPAHAAFVVGDLRRGSPEPWLAFTGDSLLVGDVGRPDLHAPGDAFAAATTLRASLDRLLELPDHVVVYPSHFGGSVCGRTLSGNPFSTIGFERRHNTGLTATDPAEFAERLLADLPPTPDEQRAIIADNRRPIGPG